MDNSLLLKTQGCCLTCLKRNTNEVISIQSAINYLNVDVKIIFSRAFEVSTETIQMDVQGTLCENCGERLDKLVKVKEEMEKLKVVLDSCLRSIHDEMRRAEDDGQMLSTVETSMCLKFVKELRMEMMNECLQAVGNSSPAQSVIATRTTGKSVKISTTSLTKNIKSSQAKQRILKPTTPKKKFACNLCLRHFSHKLLLARHRKKFHPELHLQCDMCPAIYYFTETLKRHKLTVHSTNKASILIPSSPIKSKTFKQKKLFKCNFCDKSYKDNNTLIQHQNAIHLNLWFNCERCGGSFKWKSTFNRHKPRCRKINLKGKPKTKIVEAVQLDIRRDYDIRPRTNLPNYNIDKNFMEQLDSNKINTSSPTLPKLILKIKINNEQKPTKVKSFKCDFCPMTYARKVRKLDHERVVHKGILFKCESCPKQFHSREPLRVHRNKFHIINYFESNEHDGMPTLIKFAEFQCIWCRAKFERIDARDIHMQRKCQGQF